MLFRSYVLFIAAPIAPNRQVKLAEWFGPRPFGLPVVLVVWLVLTALFLPMPWVFRHLVEVKLHASEDGVKGSLLLFLVYLLYVHQYHTHLRRSHTDAR